MYYGCKVFLAGVGCFLALSLAVPAETRAAIAQSTEVRQDSYCYKINGAGMKIFVDHNAAGAICQPPPRLDGVWPYGGPLSGGQTIYFWGINFFEGIKAYLGTSECKIDWLYPSWNWGDWAYLACTTPPSATAGYVDAKVVNSDGQSSVLPQAYLYFEPQVVISISPTSGPKSGGTQVTVTGKGFGSWTYPYPFFYNVSAGAVATCNYMTVIDSEHFTCTTSQVYGSSCGGDTKMDFYTYDMRDWSQNALYDAFTFTSPKIFANGSGTRADPFLVGTRDELDKVRYCPRMAFKQTADIELGPTCNTFEPIPYFYGSYDGSGLSIRNFCFRDPSRYYLGLFANNYGGALSNITLEDPVIQGLSNVPYWYLTYMGVGTLAGYSQGPVSGCTVINPSVKASHLTGGMIGFNLGPISKSNVIGANIDATGWYIGGLAGVSYGGGASITDSKSSGKVSGFLNVGGLVGAQWYSSIVRSSSSAKVTTYPVNGYGNGQLYFDGTGPAGGLAGNLNRAQVIDSSATGPVDAGFCIGGLTGGSGDSSISNSFATGTVTGHAIWGDDGGLLGCIGNTRIAKSFATGDVRLSGEGNYYGWSRSVGGLVGATFWGNTVIEDSFALGSVAGGESVGGFVGGENSGGCAFGVTIRRSFAAGSVSGGWHVGGFAGCLAGVASDIYALGSVAGYEYVGGLMGRNNGSITNAYSAASTVTASSGSPNVHASIGTSEVWYGVGSATNVYYLDNGVVPADPVARGLGSDAMQTQASFIGFDFTSVWRMPSANPGASLLSPVLASQCGKNGVTCP